MHRPHRVSLTAAVLTVVLAGCAVQRAGTLPDEATMTPVSGSTSASNAYAFLDAMMDRYASGSTLRLVRSFDGGGVGNFSDAVTYDDALLVMALLARGTPDDVARARIVGSALLYVQAHDPSRDGRVRAAYAPKPLTGPSQVIATDATSDTGNMAWTGIALLRLAAATGVPAYRSGALAIATWLQKHAGDTRGAGGYTGGEGERGTPIRWKSTEHNIDVYAFFTALASATKDPAWSARAQSAKALVAAMWNSQGGYFYVGTGTDGVTPNADFKAEDVNSWSYLAFADPRWAHSIDWNLTHVSAEANGYSGVSFCSGDRSGVWLEGTAHVAEALASRNTGSDARRARALLAQIAYAQRFALDADGRGIVAASKNGLRDCDGEAYFASLHVGATAWYLLALQDANPLGAAFRKRAAVSEGVSPNIAR